MNDQELTERIIFQAQQYQMPPEEFVRRIQEAGQLGAVYSDVRRSKALIAAVAAATVTDESGAAVDMSDLIGAADDSDAPEGASEADPAAVESAQRPRTPRTPPMRTRSTTSRRRTLPVRPWRRRRRTRAPHSPRVAGRRPLRRKASDSRVGRTADSEQRLCVRSVTAPSA